MGAIRPEALSKSAAEAVMDRADELSLSTITIWEVLVLARKGRIDIGVDRHAWVKDQILGSTISKVLRPSTAEIAARSESLPGCENPDPADRFLAATALEHDLVLVTADRSLRDYLALRTLW